MAYDLQLSHIGKVYDNGTPAVIDGRLVAFGGCDKVIHVLNLADGKLVNEVTRSCVRMGLEHRHHSLPAVAAALRRGEHGRDLVGKMGVVVDQRCAAVDRTDVEPSSDTSAINVVAR